MNMTVQYYEHWDINVLSAWNIIVRRERKYTYWKTTFSGPNTFYIKGLIPEIFVTWRKGQCPKISKISTIALRDGILPTLSHTFLAFDCAPFCIFYLFKLEFSLFFFFEFFWHLSFQIFSINNIFWYSNIFQYLYVYL